MWETITDIAEIFRDDYFQSYCHNRDSPWQPNCMCVLCVFVSVDNVIKWRKTILLTQHWFFKKKLFLSELWEKNLDVGISLVSSVLRSAWFEEIDKSIFLHINSSISNNPI